MASTDSTAESNGHHHGPHVNGNGVPKPPTVRGSDLKNHLNMKKKGPPGGFDDTPMPDAPPGYTIRFIFHKASNLPPSDLSTASSDPLLEATIRGTQPKRHKEDPDPTHRTKTIRRTTEPVWDDEWIVANVPPTGFTLKCRLYDEDNPASNDRLGNVTVRIPQVFEGWEGIPPPGQTFQAKKRVISKRAFVIKGVASIRNKNRHMTPKLTISMEVLGKSDPPYAQMYTVGPTSWAKHFSPMIGRIAGTKVNEDEEDDHRKQKDDTKGENPKSQKYDFQSNQMQLQGPVPPKLYHRYVEFRPVIASMFSSTGLRGKILNKALHKQHARIYNYNTSTVVETFAPCSEKASLGFLRLAHFDEGGRIFTYVLTLNGVFRFTETGKEFGIDLLSKHTMHSDVATYIACSGEFFIRRLEHPDASDSLDPREKTHPSQEIDDGPPHDDPPPNPAYYQLIIDNDSGTYRPDKSILPDLKAFLEKNFPGLGIVTKHCEDEELQKLKEAQRDFKKREGRMINLVMNRSQSSISSAESELDNREHRWEQGQKTKREAVLDAIEHPSKVKEAVQSMMPQMHGSTSRAAAASA